MKKTKIMVVEDEVIVSEDVKVTLLDFGYDVCCVVGSGEDTIRKIEEKVGEDAPDLILMDIVLPGEMDGIMAADEIRLRFDIPVIFLTAHATQEYINRAKKTEPYGYLSKPVGSKELQSNIEMALYRHSLEKKLKNNNTQLEKIMYSIVDTIAQMIKVKNPFLGEHHSRVRQLSKVIAEEMGLSQNQIEGISWGLFVCQSSYRQHYFPRPSEEWQGPNVPGSRRNSTIFTKGNSLGIDFCCVRKYKK